MGSVPSQTAQNQGEFQEEVILSPDLLDQIKVNEEKAKEVQKVFPPNILHLSALHGQAEWVQYLINLKYNVHSISDGRETPLHMTVRAKQNGIPCAKLILAAKADINARNVWGRTPLMEAVVQFKFKMMEYLISEGADINIVDCHMTSPLHVCASYGNLDAFNSLMKNGAKKNAQDERGRTSLYFAILGNHREITETLLKNNCDVNLFDPNFGSPLQKGLTMSDSNIVLSLLKAGASTSTFSSSQLSNIRLSLSEIALHTVQVSIEMCQSLETSETPWVKQGEVVSGPVSKALRHISCLKVLLIAHGFPLQKKLRDRIRHLGQKCRIPCLKVELENLLTLANRMVLPPHVGPVDTLQNISRVQCRKYLMRSKHNVIWSCEQLEIPSMLKNVLLFQL